MSTKAVEKISGSFSYNTRVISLKEIPYMLYLGTAKIKNEDFFDLRLQKPPLSL